MFVLKSVFGSLLLLAAGNSAAENKPADDWAMADTIVNAIEAPKIPNNEFVITAFGAEPGAKHDSLPAINAAIKAAVAAGGGKVTIPKGTWLSKGPIHLKSKINLHLSEGSRLLFTRYTKYYLPTVKTRWEGTELLGYSPLIYAANVKDVAITGPGHLDGNRKSSFRKWFKKQENDRQKLRKMGATGIPLKQRVFAKRSYLRPSFVQIFNAERVLLDGYKITDAPFWINHLVYTKHATVKNLRVESDFANNDGIDIESSQYVLVENNHFRTGDDSVVIKSGRDMDGRVKAIPSENIVVRNNDMGGEDGIAIGSEMSGGVKNVFFTDNVLREGSSAIRFKANLDRGGLVEHIRVRNFKVESFTNLFWFQLNYPGELGGNFPSTYKDIIFENIEVEQADVFLEAHAPKIAPLQGVTFKNIQVKKVEKHFDIENAVDLKFDNVTLGKQTLDGNLSWREK